MEVLGHDVDAAGIAYEDYAVGELLGQQVQVKHRAVGIDDKLRGSDDFLFHMDVVRFEAVLFYYNGQWPQFVFKEGSGVAEAVAREGDYT